MKRRIFLCGIFVLLMPALSLAQEYPTKPVNITVGMAVGGATDPAIRAIAAASEKFLGQPFVITNRGGGNTSIAYGEIAKARPDGYHLVGATTSGLLYVPNFREVPYTLQDFVPIVIFGMTPPTGLIVRSSSPWKTLKEFVEYAKKNPGTVNYGTSGVGGPQHLAMEYIANQEKINWTLVPFKGSSEAFTALLGGHLTAQSGGISEIVSHVKAGTVRVLGIHDAKRMKSLPDVPTFKESGYNFVSDLYLIIAAPKGTPPAVVKKLEDAFHKAIDDPQFIKLMTDMEMPIMYYNSEDSKKLLAQLYGPLEKFIKELKLQLPKQ